MKADVVAKCESLFALVQKCGKRTTSTDREESDGDAVGYGSRNERTHHTFKSGTFTIKSMEDKWSGWSPSTDRKGTTYNLEILRGSKTIFSATRNGAIHNEFFSGGDERTLGGQDTEPTTWKVSQGRMPVKFLKEKRK